MTKISSKNVHLILSDVSESNKFVCNDGTTLSNLKELSDKLKTIKKNVFAHHVNDEKNDFSTWVYDCLGDVKLTEDIRDIKDAKLMAKKIKTRITYLKKNTDRKN
jgi:hypothetical protein